MTIENDSSSSSGATTFAKIIACLLVLGAAVAWSLQVLFAVTLEKAVAMVVLGFVAVVILLISVGISPF